MSANSAFAATVSSPTSSPSASAKKASAVNFVRGLALEVLLPWAMYSVAVHLFGLREVPALMLTAIIPVADCGISLRREGRVSPVGIVVLAGVLCSLAAMLLGGGARMLLLRESLFTALLGVACLASLPTRRPLMFYFARYFAAAGDQSKVESFNNSLARPGFLSAMRVITAVWGAAFLGEFTVRALLVFHCSTATVLVVSPMLMNGIIGVTTAWNVWYGNRKRSAAQRAAIAPL